jgi:hypothetical protein
MYHKEILLLYLATHTIPYQIMANTLRALADEYEGKPSKTFVEKKYKKNFLGSMGNHDHD